MRRNQSLQKRSLKPQKNNETATPTFCTFTDEDIDAMKVPNLRKYLKDHYGTKLYGMEKPELKEKIKEAARTQLPFVSAYDPTVANNLIQDEMFATGAFWKELVPEEEVAEEVAEEVSEVATEVAVEETPAVEEAPAAEETNEEKEA